MLELLKQLRTQLIEDEAVVDPRNFQSARDRAAPLAYSIDEAVASAHRTVGMLQSSLPTMAGFEVRFAAHSTEYFSQISGKTFPKALEYGNRIVLPRLAMEVLMRNDPEFEFPCFLELTAPNHTRTFVSPLEFSCPDDRVLVLPSWLHRDLRLTEGADVKVRCVPLDHAIGLRLAPHSVRAAQIPELKSFLQEELNFNAILTPF